MEPLACGICEKADIPPDVQWLWWQSGRPIHPECDSLWSIFSVHTKRAITIMVRKVRASSRL